MNFRPESQILEYSRLKFMQSTKLKAPKTHLKAQHDKQHFIHFKQHIIQKQALYIFYNSLNRIKENKITLIL